MSLNSQDQISYQEGQVLKIFRPRKWKNFKIRCLRSRFAHKWNSRINVSRKCHYINLTVFFPPFIFFISPSLFSNQKDLFLCYFSVCISRLRLFYLSNPCTFDICKGNLVSPFLVLKCSRFRNHLSTKVEYKTLTEFHT